MGKLRTQEKNYNVKIFSSASSRENLLAIKNTSQVHAMFLYSSSLSLSFPTQLLLPKFRVSLRYIIVD